MQLALQVPRNSRSALQRKARRRPNQRKGSIFHKKICQFSRHFSRLFLSILRNFLSSQTNVCRILLIPWIFLPNLPNFYFSKILSTNFINYFCQARHISIFCQVRSFFIIFCQIRQFFRFLNYLSNSWFRFFN